MDFKTTEEISVPERLIDQVIGQDHAVEVIKKAAKQKRNVLLIGEPGTGKSMLGMAMAELLPVEELEDILVFPNPEDRNNPKIKVVRAGEGEKIVKKYKEKKKQSEAPLNTMFKLLFFAIVVLVLYYSIVYESNILSFTSIPSSYFSISTFCSFINFVKNVGVPDLNQ